MYGYNLYISLFIVYNLDNKGILQKLYLSLELSTYTGGGETGKLSLFGNNTKPPKKSEEPCSGEGKYTSYTHYLHYVRTHTIWILMN